MSREPDDLKFEKLFGTDRKSFPENIILSPFLNPSLGKSLLQNSETFRGMLYRGVRGSFQGATIAFVRSGIGQSLVSDCVLAQNAQRTRRIIFLGAAGSLADFRVADRCVIDTAFFDTEFFSQYGLMFEKNAKEKNFPADTALLSAALSLAKQQGIALCPSDIVSLQSLWDQKDAFLAMLAKNGRQLVDLECAMFYAAAIRQRIPALAFCYVSDLPNSVPYWRNFSDGESAAVRASVDCLLRLALAVCSC